MAFLKQVRICFGRHRKWAKIFVEDRELFAAMFVYVFITRKRKRKIIVTHIRTIIRSTISRWIDSLEDPKQIIERTLLDMHESRSQLRWRYTCALATKKRLVQRLSELRSRICRGSEPRPLAAGEGHSSDEYQTSRWIDHYLNLVRIQEGLISSLGESLAELEANLEKGRLMRVDLLSRKEAVEARLEINAALTGVSVRPDAFGQEYLSTFKRMENCVSSLECEADALAELRLEMDRWEAGGDFAGSRAVSPENSQMDESKSTPARIENR